MPPLPPIIGVSADSTLQYDWHFDGRYIGFEQSSPSNSTPSPRSTFSSNSTHSPSASSVSTTSSGSQKYESPSVENVTYPDDTNESWGRWLSSEFPNDEGYGSGESQTQVQEKLVLNVIPLQSSVITSSPAVIYPARPSLDGWHDRASPQEAPTADIWHQGPSAVENGFEHYEQNLTRPRTAQQTSKPGPGIHPRRTRTTGAYAPPTLARQKGRREDFVMHLVESATQLVAHIWPASNTSSCPVSQSNSNQVITLPFFIQETLRRSRTTYSTLQLALYYLYLINIRISLLMQAAPVCRGELYEMPRAMRCGRRMFLAGLILASKYLQDRTYSTKAWSKITSLPVQDINANEKIFLQAIDYSLHLPVKKYEVWGKSVEQCVDAATRGRPCPWGTVLTAFTMSQAGNQPATSFPMTVASSGDARLSGLPSFFEGGPRAYHTHTSPSNELPDGPPPAPTLKSNLTTPQVSPWSVNGSTPAASVSSHTHQTTSGATDSATIESALTTFSIVASPLSLTEPSRDLTREPPSRLVSYRPTRSSRGPSPLRSCKSQLPTPPLSANLAHALDAPTPMPTTGGWRRDDAMAHLCRHAAIESQRHGLRAGVARPCHGRAALVDADGNSDVSTSPSSIARLVSYGSKQHLRPEVQRLNNSARVQCLKRGCSVEAVDGAPAWKAMKVSTRCRA